MIAAIIHTVKRYIKYFLKSLEGCLPTGHNNLASIDS